MGVSRLMDTINTTFRSEILSQYKAAQNFHLNVSELIIQREKRNNCEANMLLEYLSISILLNNKH